MRTLAGKSALSGDKGFLEVQIVVEQNPPKGLNPISSAAFRFVDGLRYLQTFCGRLGLVVPKLITFLSRLIHYPHLDCDDRIDPAVTAADNPAC